MIKHQKNIAKKKHKAGGIGAEKTRMIKMIVITPKAWLRGRKNKKEL